MMQFIDIISQEVMRAFEACGYEPQLGRVTISNRPDLCEFQCNGAMAGAKQYRKAPLAIAQEVVALLASSTLFSGVEAVAPGFINLSVKENILTEYLREMNASHGFGVEAASNPRKIVIDYGGPNVAKPLHVGHLRSAIIGESIKRILRFSGHQVIGDIHMGDWGLQMGLIIALMRERNPEMPYFDKNYKGAYPKEAPFTIGQLEEIYPNASARSKEDEEFRDKAVEATVLLQNGEPGYRALWKHIMSVSIADLKKNYKNLCVEFDLWKGESDVHDRIAGMVDNMKKEGYATVSEGALIVDVKEDTDAKEVPPCMLLKSNGAALYHTTDLATIMERVEKYKPTDIIYVVDKRQDLNFVQVFRCARKTGIVDESVNLQFIGFGTMNGKDGKPFKTRDGGVMRLETLQEEINEAMFQKIVANREVSDEEARKTARIVGLAAVKYGDLSNQASKDYVFDVDRFTSFEGDTGPYILYTIVRIKSILNRYREMGGSFVGLSIKEATSPSEKALMLQMALFSNMVEGATAELAPHRVCAYTYELANAFNTFYHETKILTQENSETKAGWIALLVLARDMMSTCIDLLGFSAPERM